MRASLESTSKRWSSVLATEALLLVLLVCEPLVVASTSNAASEALLISNVMAAVATPFVLLLAVAASRPPDGNMNGDYVVATQDPSASKPFVPTFTGPTAYVSLVRFRGVPEDAFLTTLVCLGCSL